MDLLPVPRTHDTNTATSNILESNMEPTELVTDDKEDTKRFLRVLKVGQETRCKAERQCYFGWLVEVRLQHVSINACKPLQEGDTESSERTC